MKKEEILEGNKLIAYFMGATNPKNHPGDYLWFAYGHQGQKLWATDKLIFHESWDWLMPVVEKIESLEDGEYMFEICGSRAEISLMINHNWPHDKVTLQEFNSKNSSSKIESVWLTCVNFVKDNYDGEEKENSTRQE